MKKLITLFAAVAVLFAFASCSNGNSDSDSGSSGGHGVSSYINLEKYQLLNEFKDKKVAAWYEWKNKEISHYEMYQAYVFFEDKTYFFADLEGLSSLKCDANQKGTYTGDPTKDGDIVLTNTHRTITKTNSESGNQYKEWKEESYSSTSTITIKNSMYINEFAQRTYYKK